MRELLKELWADSVMRWLLISVAVLSIGTPALTISLGLIFARHECQVKGELMKLKTDWLVIGGCMVTTKDGQIVPLRQYRVID